jgi:ABC-2 type transport system ATP-binding protein
MILVASRVRLAGDIDELLASHRQLIGAHRDNVMLPGAEVITARHTERQTTLVVRTQRTCRRPGLGASAKSAWRHGFGVL